MTSHLSVLPAGRPDANPMDALTCAGLKRLLEEAAKQFDWVLLNTPPVGLITDANLVARLADGVLFVICAGSTPYEDVQRAIAEIGPERIVGTLLNRAESSSNRVAGYYYGYDSYPVKKAGSGEEPA